MGQDVFDMGGLCELEATILHKRNIQPGEGNLQIERMEAGPEKDRHFLQRYSLTLQLFYFLANILRLFTFVDWFY